TSAGRGEVVVLGAAAQLRDLPLGLDPAPVLETMEGRIERALVDLQDVLGNLLDALGDGPAVLGILLQRAEDQQIERAGQQIGRSRHGVDYRHYDVLVSTVNTKPASHQTSARVLKFSSRGRERIARPNERCLAQRRAGRSAVGRRGTAG